MTNLEKVKTLIDIDRVCSSTEGQDFNINYHLVQAKSQLEEIYGITLESTTPKTLYNRPYGKLTKEEVNEYTQIKRLIERYNKEKL